MTHSILSAIKKLWSFLTPKEKWQCSKIAGFSLLISILEIITASTVVIFTQALNQPEISRKYFQLLHLDQVFPDKYDIFYIALSMGIVYCIKNIFSIFSTFYEYNAIHQMRHRFKVDLLIRYTKADYNFYLTKNASEGLSIVASDVNLSFTNGLAALTILLSESIVLIFLLSMLVYMNPSLALIILGIGLILYFTLTKMVFPKFYRWGKSLQKTTQYSHQHLLQFFHAFKEIILLGKRKVFIEAYQEHSQQDAQLQAIQTASNVLPRMIIELLFMSFFVISVFYLCFQGTSSQKMLSILGVYLYAGFRLMPGLNRIITQLNVFKTVVPAIERIDQEYHSSICIESFEDTPDFCFEKNIVLRDVSFQYLNQNKATLRNINFVINKGECIGIIGKSGSGKSTLIDVVLGLLKPYEGIVLVDDRYSVRSLQWHSQVGYVQQAIYLTDDTITANIAFGEHENINWDRLDKAIHDSQLEVLINKLPLGLETIVGERGIRLSGGERQRIAIARALYRNPNVLIFDEATSALDNETEKAIMEIIHNIHSSNKTIIIIAHRLSTLKYCDRIISICNGHIEQPVIEA